MKMRFFSIRRYDWAWSDKARSGDLIGKDDTGSSEVSTELVFRQPKKVVVEQPLPSVPSGVAAPRSTIVSFELSRNEDSKKAANSEFADRCWYKALEYEAFKKNDETLVKELNKSTKKVPRKFEKVSIGIYLALCMVGEEVDCTTASVLSKQELAELKSITISLDHLGVERLTVPFINEDICDRRKVMLDKVLEIQTSTNISVKIKAELTKRILESTSRPSRLYALEKARALAAASC